MTAERPEPWPHIEGELRKALSCPIEDLAQSKHRALPADAGEHWNIPTADRAALRDWGLPRLALFTATPQTGHEPLVAPNPTTEAERRLLKGDIRLYKLGFWGRSEENGITGVTPGDGRVFYLLPAQITVDDLPEVLKPQYPGLYKPAVSLFSSSVTQFVETAWRWHACLKILRNVEDPAYTSPESELTAHYERLYGCVDVILDAARHIDPEAVAEDSGSAWTELIRANSV